MLSYIVNVNMSLNDRDILKQSSKGDIYPGFANPTTSSNSLMPTDPREANFVRYSFSPPSFVTSSS